ncbi:MAG: hypothetical protein WCI60_02665 [bacterium]
MREKYSQNNIEVSDKAPDPFLEQNAVVRRAILLSMDWDNLNDNEKLEAMPGLGYN